MGTNYYLQRVAGHEVFDEWPAADLDSYAGVRFHPVSKLAAGEFYGSYPDDPPNVGSLADLCELLARGDFKLATSSFFDDSRFPRTATSREVLDGLAAVASPFAVSAAELYREGDYLDPQGYFFSMPAELEADFMLRRTKPRIEHERFHLCKCSWGWRTTWEATELVRSVADARRLATSGEWQVVDEYGDACGPGKPSIAKIAELCTWCPDGRDQAREFSGIGTTTDPEGYPFSHYEFV